MTIPKLFVISSTYHLPPGARIHLIYIFWPARSDILGRKDQYGPVECIIMIQALKLLLRLVREVVIIDGDSFFSTEYYHLASPSSMSHLKTKFTPLGLPKFLSFAGRLAPYLKQSFQN